MVQDCNGQVVIMLVSRSIPARHDDMPAAQIPRLCNVYMGSAYNNFSELMSNIFDPIFKVHSACVCVRANVFQTHTRHKSSITLTRFNFPHQSAVSCVCCRQLWSRKNIQTFIFCCRTFNVVAVIVLCLAHAGNGAWSFASTPVTMCVCVCVRARVCVCVCACVCVLA